MAMRRYRWHGRPNCNSALQKPIIVHELTTDNSRLPTG